MTKGARMDRNTFKTRVHKQGNETLRVQYGMSWLKGNRQPYFSITAELFEGAIMVSCGCLHELIATRLPELAEMIQWHLVDQDGTPMHYQANGQYHLDKGAMDHFKSTVCYQNGEGIPTSGDFTLWAIQRLPKVQERFKACMARHGVEFIPAQ